MTDYLKAEYEKLDAEDKSILHRYVKPGAEIVSGSLGVVLSGVAGGGSCAETFGLGCAETFGLGCAATLVGVTSSYDHVITGTKNFEKKNQRATTDDYGPDLEAVGVVGAGCEICSVLYRFVQCG